MVAKLSNGSVSAHCAEQRHLLSVTATSSSHAVALDKESKAVTLSAECVIPALRRDLLSGYQGEQCRQETEALSRQTTFSSTSSHDDAAPVFLCRVEHEAGRPQFFLTRVAVTEH